MRPMLLVYLIRLVGADCVMLGSDYCFDMGYTRPPEMIERKLKKVDRAKILGSTAARRLRLR